MEEPNIRREEAKGRENFQAAQNRFAGLIKDAKPPGLRDDTEDVEINEKDIIAHRYREAFESVRPMIENQMLINIVAGQVRSSAEQGAKKEQNSAAWNAARRIADIRSLGLWERVQKETQEEIEGYLRDQTLIDNMTDKICADAREDILENINCSLDVALGVATLRYLGLWDELRKEAREELDGYFVNQTFIDDMFERARLHAKAGAGRDIYSAWDATLGAAALRALGLWERVQRETQEEIEGYLRDQTLIDHVVGEVHTQVENVMRGNIGFALNAIPGAAALKTLAEHFELEAKKLRDKQGAEAARKPQTDKTLLNILPEKKF